MTCIIFLTHFVVMIDYSITNFKINICEAESGIGIHWHVCIMYYVLLD